MESSSSPVRLKRPELSRSFWSRVSSSKTVREELKPKLARCLILIFINFSLWIMAGIIFKLLEGGLESSFKCGVKRVRRDFIDTLWNETQHYDEDAWKSSARRRLIEFENELHDAVDAGIHTYSGQTSWSIVNSIVYSFSVASTIGYNRLSPTTSSGRLFSIAYMLIANPVFYLLMVELSGLVVCLLFHVSQFWVTDSTDDASIKRKSFFGDIIDNMFSNWKLMVNEAKNCDRYPFLQLFLPPALSCLIFFVWAFCTSFIYSLIIFTSPVESIFAILSPTATVGFVESDHEDSTFFVVSCINMIVGMVVYFVYNISIQIWIWKSLDSWLTKYLRNHSTSPTTNGKAD